MSHFLQLGSTPFRFHSLPNSIPAEDLELNYAIEAPSIFGMTIMVAQSDTQDCELQTMDGAKVGLGCRLDTI